MKTMGMVIRAASAAILIGSLMREANAEPTNPPLSLAANGSTRYQIVMPGTSSPVDDYAVNALTNFLFQKTGAVFPVVPPGGAAPTESRIFVGLSEPALKIVGADPLSKLEDQEYVVRSAGDDILLYGKGMHGNLYAVVDFMEKTLGRRWYSARQYTETPQWQVADSKPIVTVERDLSVQPFSRKGGFAFAYRLAATTYSFDFDLQGGMNMVLPYATQRNVDAFSLKVMSQLCHTLFGYIPPSPKLQSETNVFSWVANKDYFTSNPDFFTMDKYGKRVVGQQLCFSNPGLRQELSRNILEHIRILKDQGRQRLLIDVSAHDGGGEFCYCPGCQELKKKYQAVGGPFYDYLCELCAAVKGKHPDTMIHTLAYRLSQTQKPPVMPAGQAFPDNLVVQFADVEDNADADWNSPVNRPTYEDLLAWGKLTPHLWTWYYPFNGMIDRMVTDIRLMKKAGVEGVFLELYDLAGTDFIGMQNYVYHKLLQDVDCDVPELIREFTDYQYGPAAPLARTYLREMEEAWKLSSTNTSFSAQKGYSRALTGVTTAMIRRWQESFDRMEGLTARDMRLQQNVRRLRRGLDYRTLGAWNSLTKESPGYFGDYLVVRKRIGAPPPWDVARVEDLEMMIKLAGTEKPLPAPFDGMDKALVRRFVPTRIGSAPEKVMDSEAAFGYAAVVHLPDKPFTFGFYQNDTTTHGAKYTVSTNDISMGSYRIYPLGEIHVTPDSIVWFSSRSWVTQLQLGERLYSPPAPDNDNRYDVHVSLKFDKPIGKLDTSAPYAVLCDQIIFVKKTPQQ